jgi:release factor glutamine methyltransferase
VPLTLLDILRSSAAYLRRAGLERPRLEAEVLMGYVLHLERLQLYLQFERPLDERELSDLRSILKQRAVGTPVAYLVGQREFFGLCIAVREGVLVPRPESELLVELALARLTGRESPQRGADLGTGSGCLGIAIAAGAPSLRVDAVDVSEIAVEVALRNAARLGVGNRVSIFQGSWCDPLLDRGPYDLIVSNPPYVTSAELAALDHGVRDFEPQLALDAGEDGLDPYRELMFELPRITTADSAILLEVDPSRARAVVELAEKAWPGTATLVHHDLAGRDRVVEVTVP